jgi:hypothetical protein
MTVRCWCGQELLVREPLPTRRGGETFSFEHRGLHFNATTGRRGPDEPIAEVFLNIAPTKGGKYGSDSDLAARDAAVAVSLALQHGVPLGVLQRAMGKELDGTPSSPIGKLLELIVSMESQNAPTLERTGDAGKAERADE